MKAFARKGKYALGWCHVLNVRPPDRCGALHAFIAALVVALALFAIPRSLSASELIQSVEIYEDTTGTETIGSIGTLAFQPSSAALNLGYSPSVFWLRVKLRNPQESGDGIVLKVAPATVGSVTLFQSDPTAPSGWRRNDAFEHLSSTQLGLRIRSAASVPTVYLRVSSVGTIRLKLSAHDMEDAIRQTIVQTALRTGYLAALAVLALWALRIAVVTREPIFLTFGLLQSIWMAHNLFGFGLSHILPMPWLADHADTVYRILVLCASFMTIGFYRSVLSKCAAHRLVLLVLRIMQFNVACAMAFFWAGDRQVALQFNALLIILMPFVILFAALTIRAPLKSHEGLVKYLTVGNSLAMMSWVLGLTGHFQALIGFDTAIVLHGTCTGLLMLVVLSKRNQDFMRRLEEAELGLIEERVRGGVQREQNSLLGSFLDLLAHETRNAHAVVLMNLSNPALPEKPYKRILTTLSRLDLMVERSVQVAKLEASAFSVQTEQMRLLDVIRDALAGVPGQDRIDISTRAPEIIVSDRLLLKVAVANLVENALKYSPEGSRVGLEVTGSRGELTVTVTNDLGATPPPSPEEVFRKFYRGSGTETLPGTGLGLYLVKSIANMLNGRVDCQFGERSAQFTLRVPC